MVRLPWGDEREGGSDGGGSEDGPGGSDGGEADEERPPGGIGVEATVECAFQDGTLFVYDDHVFIERAGPSKFGDKAIPRDEITDVRYSKGVVIGYLQVEQVGFENDSGGFLTSPVDENTLHFGRGARGCAERAQEELLFGGS